MIELQESCGVPRGFMMFLVIHIQHGALDWRIRVIRMPLASFDEAQTAFQHVSRVHFY